MAVRALIIACQSYPAIQGGMARELPGTLDSALKLRDWLTQKWQAEGRAPADTQMLFCSSPPQPGGQGATFDDIFTALQQLKSAGQGATEQLWFYFSGHGFMYSERPGSRADAIAAADFVSPLLSGRVCFLLDEIVSWLRDNLGPGQQFYFIDACRNRLDPRQTRVNPQLTVDPQASGEASTFVLQSTTEGAVAAVGGPFPDVLLNGLRGQGKAKTWRPTIRDEMFVRYDTLRFYLKSTLVDQPITSRVEGPDGESDAVLAALRPVPLVRCVIEFAGPAPEVTGQLSYVRGHGGAAQVAPFTGPRTELALEPDEYSVSLRIDGVELDPPGAMPMELYADQTLVFRPRRLVRGGGGTEAVETMLEAVVPPDTVLELRHVQTGLVQAFENSGPVSLPFGRYEGALRGLGDGVVFRQAELELLPGSRALSTMASWQNSAPHRAIAGKLMQDGAGGVFFSEQLGGPVADPDLDIWLALLGSGRILGGEHAAAPALKLHDFTAGPSGAAVYLLAGFSKVRTRLKVSVSRGPTPSWVPVAEVDAMPGMHEALVATEPGALLVSVAIGAEVALTVASLVLPDRVTLVTLTLDGDGVPRIGQYLVGPLGTDRAAMRDALFLAQSQRAFRRRQDLGRQIQSPVWAALHSGTWIDPIATPLAGYEALRRGRVEDARAIAAIMRAALPYHPDTATLSHLTGGPFRTSGAAPLFFDGLRAIPNYAGLPLPPDGLDFTSPWTAWRDTPGD